MTKNQPSTCVINPSAFAQYAKQKAAKNREAVRNALEALAAVTLDKNNDIGISISDAIIDEAVELLADMLMSHEIGVCRPGMRQKLLSDPEIPCWQYQPGSLMRCDCYNNATCPICLWHRQTGTALEQMPLDEDDAEIMKAGDSCE